jgi:ubiquitin-protein ligase
MMSARLRRLSADHERIRAEFGGHPHIDIEAARGNPPERYRVTYNVPGLIWNPDRNRPEEKRRHVVDIYLHSGYPREKPQCIPRSEVFHPNFGNYVCIGDHWAAGETLSDVIVQIGEMIQYRQYNTKSAINARAARWAEHNRHLLPIGNIDLYLPEPDVTIHSLAAPPDEEIDITLGPEVQVDDLEIELR